MIGLSACFARVASNSNHTKKNQQWQQVVFTGLRNTICTKFQKPWRYSEIMMDGEVSELILKTFKSGDKSKYQKIVNYVE